ncbi:MAG: glycogen debranching enzyme GlgX [Candidatus Melainabacteria bacterium]|nr:MAG: glycogen debranching enzyme GlgX [Candidatus Melainabacteria bacterium]
MQHRVYKGTSFPLGATVYPDGINFSVFSAHAESVDLLLFESHFSPEPYQIVQLNKPNHCTYNYWHAFISSIGSGQVYAFRVYGAYLPESGLRFDANKVLLDPYAKFIVGWDSYNRQAAIDPGDNCAQALRSVAIDSTSYDWENDAHPRTPFAESVIYELHVGAFTQHPNSGLEDRKRGTFAGLIEKIPYLKELGVTAVELMPIHQFDEHDARKGLTNYWGYSTVGFFAPHLQYCAAASPMSSINEFRDLVKALHKAGIEVILDVVFNHTAEGNESGPTLCFRGWDNPTYYILNPADQSRYENFSGCGNTFNANHPVPGRLILDSLRYWVSEMHVDGFRFDLAAALGRGISGEPLNRPPVLWAIESDPCLAGTKLIAEAWDAAGLYAIGRFVNVGHWYAEWNGPFRDDARRFIKGDNGTVRKMSLRIAGSSDLYIDPDRDIGRSINFITCHDGFTLNDLVSYNSKHNEANGESNRDGSDNNYSWNCGFEGPSKDQQVENLRLRQIKNLLTILFVSYGTPMISMGDEIRRTQLGNNNAYCQNNRLAWFDWDQVRASLPLLRFLRLLISNARHLQILRLNERLSSLPSSTGPSISWHGVKLMCPDWSEESHSIAFTLNHPLAGEHLHVMLNTYWDALAFDLPQVSSGLWHKLIDTSLESPLDIVQIDESVPIDTNSLMVQARSSVVLIAK